MWVPHSAARLEEAAGAGEFAEKAALDAKADLPHAKRSHTLAVDVAAMTVDGGVLVYGLSEDEHRRPTIPKPIELTGARERIDLIVGSSILEVPEIEIIELPLDQEPSRGYVVVVVPASPRAPHQVAVRGDFRFYGRGATGNRILTQGEIDRLYDRRRRWQVDREEVLERTVQRAPFPPTQEVAFAHAFARPVATDDDLLARAGGTDPLERLRDMHATASRMRLRPLFERYDPDLRREQDWTQIGADGWRLARRRNPSDHPRYYVEAAITHGATGTLFLGRAADTNTHGYLFFATITAGNLATFLRLMGELYARAGYRGPVDLGLAITNMRGALLYRGTEDWPRRNPTPFSTDEYRETLRVEAGVLIAEAGETSFKLLRRLLAAMTQGEPDSPFVDTTD